MCFVSKFGVVYCRAGPSGPSLSAYNYDSNFGKKSLMVMYRGIMEQVFLIKACSLLTP
jgi:hypothetical protein